jgi:hypothetical protein
LLIMNDLCRKILHCICVAGAGGMGGADPAGRTPMYV